MLARAKTNGIVAYPAFTCPLLYKTYPAPIKVKIINITLNIRAVFFMVSSLSTPICPFDFTTFISYLPLKIQGIATATPHTSYRSNDFSISCFYAFSLFCFSYRSFRSLQNSFMRSNRARRQHKSIRLIVNAKRPCRYSVSISENQQGFLYAIDVII